MKHSGLAAVVLTVAVAFAHTLGTPSPLGAQDPQRVPPARPDSTAADPTAARDTTLRVFELEGLVVTATPVPVPLNSLGTYVTVVDGDDLRSRGVIRVLDALREVTSISVLRNGSFGAVSSVFFRGGESDHTLVLVDGVQVNQPGGSFDFSSLTTESIERIEIVRGPSSALYGSDAVSGVIQIITRKGSGDLRATLSSQAGSFGRFDGGLSVSGGGGRASYGLDLARYSTDGILDFNNGHDNTVLNGRLDLAVDDASQLKISARVTDRTYRFPTDFTGAVVDINQQTFQDETLVSVGYDRRLGARFDVRALVTLYDVSSGTDDRPDSPADTLGSFGFQSLDELTRTQGDVRLNWLASERTTFSAGVEFEEQQVTSFNESLSQWGTSTGESENRRINRGVYAHVVTGRGAFDANAGMRLEDNEQFGGFFTWQAGASLKLADATRVRGAFGIGIKEPTFFEAFAKGFTVGNPDLQPERSRSIELGLEQTLFDGALELQATAFDQDFTDLIQYTGAPEPGTPNYYNVAEASSRGLEVGATAKLPAGVLLTAAFTRLDTEVLDAGFQTGANAVFVEGEALLRRPRDQMRIGAAWNAHRRVRADVSALRVGARSDRDFTAWPTAVVTLPAYTLFDASLEARVIEARAGRPGFTLVLRGENLFDEDYVEVWGFRTPGRGLYVGGRLQVGG